MQPGLGMPNGVAAQSRLLQQRVRLQKKLPELRKALDTVLLLLSKQVRPGGGETAAGLTFARARAPVRRRRWSSCSRTPYLPRRALEAAAAGSQLTRRCRRR